jgi:hypothetical protein
MTVYKAMAIPSYYRRNWNASGWEWVPPRLTSNTSNTGEIQFVDPKLSGGTMTDAGVMTWGTAAIQRFDQVWKAFRGEQAQNNAWIINNGSRTFTVLDIVFPSAKNITKVEIYCPVIGGYHSEVTGVAIYDMSSGSPVQLKYDLTFTNASGLRGYAISRNNVSKLRICIRPNTNGDGYPSMVQRIVIYASNGGKAPYAVSWDENGDASRVTAITGSGEKGSTLMWYAFDGDNSSEWEDADGHRAGAWLEYRYSKLFIPTKVVFRNRSNYVVYPDPLRLQGSADGVNYFDYGEFDGFSPEKSGITTINISTNTPCKYLRFVFAGATNGSGGANSSEASFAGIEIYGKVNTSDTKLPNFIGADYATYQYKVRKVTSGSTTRYQFKKN